MVTRSRSSRESEVLSLLGLARRAGAIVSGGFRVREALRHGRARFVLLACDAAEGQTGKLKRIMERRGIPHRITVDRERLGSAVGESPRSAVAVVDRGFADRLAQLLESLEEHDGAGR